MPQSHGRPGRNGTGSSGQPGLASTKKNASAYGTPHSLPRWTCMLSCTAQRCSRILALQALDGPLLHVADLADVEIHVGRKASDSKSSRLGERVDLVVVEVPALLRFLVGGVCFPQTSSRVVDRPSRSTCRRLGGSGGYPTANGPPRCRACTLSSQSRSRSTSSCRRTVFPSLRGRRGRSAAWRRGSGRRRSIRPRRTASSGLPSIIRPRRNAVA